MIEEKKKLQHQQNFHLKLCWLNKLNYYKSIGTIFILLNVISLINIHVTDSCFFVTFFHLLSRLLQMTFHLLIAFVFLLLLFISFILMCLRVASQHPLLWVCSSYSSFSRIFFSSFCLPPLVTCLIQLLFHQGAILCNRLFEWDVSMIKHLLSFLFHCIYSMRCHRSLGFFFFLFFLFFSPSLLLVALASFKSLPLSIASLSLRWLKSQCYSYVRTLVMIN